MLPPPAMVTTKNRLQVLLPLILLPILLPLLGGCKPPGPKALLKGIRQLDRGDAAAAVVQLQRAVSLIPTNAQAWNYLGLAYHAANQPNEATQAYQKAFSVNPNLAEAHYNLGCLALEQNQTTTAKSELTAYTLSRPKDINGWLRLATVQWRTRDPNGAEKSYNEARRLDADNPEALNGLGMIQLSRNRTTEAQAFFVAAVKTSPNYAPALLNLAIIRHQYLGNRHAALENYRAYLNLKPAPANANAVAAIVQSLEAELSPAPPPPTSETKSIPAPTVPKPTAVVRPTPPPPKLLPPSEPPVATPKPEPSVAVQANTSKPATAASSTVSTIPTLAAPPKVDALPTSLPVASKNISLYPYRNIQKPKPGDQDTANQLFKQGMEAQKQKRLPEALAAFLAATRADPTYFQAYYNAGWTAYALKDWTTALDAYETALALEPESSETRLNFAQALAQAKYPLDAANELERLLTKRPNDADAHLLLANLYTQELNSPHLARPHYVKFLKLEPRHPQSTQIRYWLSENNP